MWYTKLESARRFNIWYCSLGFSQIIGGLISWVTRIPLVLMLYLTRGIYISQGFQHFTGISIHAWRLMFILLGVLSTAVGLFTIILMPDNQMSAKWISDAEKAAAIRRVAVNQTGIQNTHFKWSHLRELILDLQMWLLAVLTILVCLSTSINLIS